MYFKILIYLLNHSQRFNRLLIIPEFRDTLVKKNYYRLMRNRKLQFINNQNGITSNTISHNIDPNRMFFSDLSKRPVLISKPLSCDSSIIQNASSFKILLVGARTEAEILSFRLCGFTAKNIHAIDLASYSPLIKLMNAESLDFPDDYFDVVVLGWVLEFVEHPLKVISEISRVIKNNGIIAIGAMYHPSSQDMKEYQTIKKHQDRVWVPKNTKDINTFFNFSSIIFNSDINQIDSDKRSDLILIGRFKK